MRTNLHSKQPRSRISTFLAASAVGLALLTGGAAGASAQNLSLVRDTEIENLLKD
jgi:hypothetical protein